MNYSNLVIPKRISTFIQAVINLVAGGLIGLLLLEGVLRANPILLLHGMATYRPIDLPLQDTTYDVRTSDADLFMWEAGRLPRVAPEQDRVEAHVSYQTDELGFRNAAPLPEQADLVVLGRSFSLGLQATHHWPEILSSMLGWRVINLSQAGSGIYEKQAYLRNFGLPRHPKWVVLEVLPSMDIIGYLRPDPFLVHAIPLPIAQSLLRQWMPPAAASAASIRYPLNVQISTRTIPLAFFSYYLASLTVSSDMLIRSQSWHAYKRQALELVEMARRQSACFVLLYVPTRENIYFSIAPDVSVFQPAVEGVSPWTLTGQGVLSEAQGQLPDLHAMQQNANAGRDLLADFARENKLPFADPTSALIQAIQAGKDPYMILDTHWSDLGHQLVAQVVAETIGNRSCP